jgi:hypothetical protein
LLWKFSSVQSSSQNLFSCANEVLKCTNSAQSARSSCTHCPFLSFYKFFLHLFTNASCFYQLTLLNEVSIPFTVVCLLSKKYKFHCQSVISSEIVYFELYKTNPLSCTYTPSPSEQENISIIFRRFLSLYLLLRHWYTFSHHFKWRIISTNFAICHNNMLTQCVQCDMLSSNTSTYFSEKHVFYLRVLFSFRVDTSDWGLFLETQHSIASSIQSEMRILYQENLWDSERILSETIIISFYKPFFGAKECLNLLCKWKKKVSCSV